MPSGSTDARAILVDIARDWSQHYLVPELIAWAYAALGTFQGGSLPEWSSDGRDVFYADGGRVLYRQRADGSAPAEAVVTASGLSGGFQSPDGKWLVLRSGGDACCDILGLRTGVDTAPVPLLATPFHETSPALSPDGRWLAYVSDESGPPEVYVRRDMIAVRVASRPTFTILGRRRLFSAAGYYTTNALGNRVYDLARDGRFLMLRVGAASRGQAVPLVLVENFLVELAAKVPR
jgi:WD40-like Beta Propeller Repeat